MVDRAKSRVTGVLLAGGLSRRMGGGDKCLRDLAGKPMLAHIIERLKPQVGAMVINANGDPARFAQFGLDVVPDTIGGFAGPLAGVLAGMRWSATHAPEALWVVTVSNDAPFLPLDLTERFLAAVPDERTIALAASGGDVHPVIGLWPVALGDDLDEQLKAGVRKVLHWTDRHSTVVVEFPFLELRGRMIDPFFNANTPEELEEARALMESRSP